MFPKLRLIREIADKPGAADAGLGKSPQAVRMEVDENGNIVGLH